MDRLGVAIEKATAAGMSAGNPSELTATSMTVNKDCVDDPKRWYIIATFGSKGDYTIPWAACYNWNATEALLKEWFRGDEDAVRDISNGDILIENYRQGQIHPQTWNQVITHKMEIVFTPNTNQDENKEPDKELELDKRSGSYQYSDSSVDSDEEFDAKCESRIQYVVNYYKRTMNEVHTRYVGASKRDKPVEFELTYEEKRPALEETKDVETVQDITKEQIKAEDGTKAKLGPLDRVVSTKLQIYSPFIRSILKAVIEYTATSSDDTSFGLVSGLSPPYKLLYYYMADLANYKSEDSELRRKHSDRFNERCDKHIDVILEYLSAQESVPLNEFNARIAQKTPVVTFAMYWLILKPGADVYVREEDGSLNAYVLHSVTGGVSEKYGQNRSSHYNLSVWNLAFDGTDITPGLRHVEVSIFDNAREITSLPVFPVRFIDNLDNGAFKAKLINRGKKYFEFSKRPSFLQYTGQGLKKGAKKYKRSRVVVTHAMAPWDNELAGNFIGTHHTPEDDADTISESVRVPRCECYECTANESQEVYAKGKFSDYYRISPSNTGELSAHQYMIMASHMYAFSLKERSYDLLAVDGLEAPVMIKTAMDKLVMDENNKELIKAIARIYTDGDQTDRFSADFIQGKGEGQIFLLHGPPGTGKTLTAESIAEYTKRPLLSITASDLGHEPDELERSLLRYFKMASDWDAIVLLDEADVYLRKRTVEDLRHNSIVSVFLRALDYFQGILFLTTNRVGQIDEAFLSRIHLSLGYEPLSNAARVKIWDNLFGKLDEDHKRGGRRINYHYHAKSYVQSQDVQALKWNGREIRNAFQTAVALALFEVKKNESEDPPEVTENHLKQVVSMSSAFKKYMAAVNSGMDDATLAQKHGNRDDRYPSTPAKQVS
ncbi:ATP synthase D chain, mitochondrial [Pyrenophora tritici-repentis]|nr:ATP synthase D chain, mitochondrial [Pyrenophora tritici-repentis]